ncbi:tetratricopeptide repeat protein [Campylobacter sp. CCUG 57310]|uniref:tetratricopeptide repeat protein n=1 Tax=Campylobacter sp. CCUG 57310 TaxID=2517362 RepID=UPI0015656FA8|nr:tetratricopeptide repeat protein [Campylobacter sp. CCUG 57310]
MIKILYVLLFFTLVLNAGIDNLSDEEALCNSGDARSCLVAGASLLEGDERGYEKGVKFHKKACDMGLGFACYCIGSFYLHGAFGLTMNRYKASEFFHVACNLEEPLGCRYLAFVYFEEDTKEQDIKANNLLKKACLLNDIISCKELGISYALAAKLELKYPKINASFQMACEINDSLECYLAATRYATSFEPSQNQKIINESFYKYCKFGYAKACLEIAYLYYDGVDLKLSYEKAGELFKTACDGKLMQACYELGSLYESGYGVDMDINRAKELYKNACEMNF